MIHFSVITPTYNRSDLICSAIDSVLNQSYQSFELIVIDDGSTDNTSIKIRTKYPDLIASQKIRLIQLDRNSGSSHARNVGLRKATHPWITYLDSDNTWKPNFLQTIKDAILKHPDVQLFCCRGICRVSGNTVGPHSLDILNHKYLGCDTGGIVHTKKLTDQWGGFDPRVVPIEDTDLVVNFQKQKCPMVVIEEALYEYNDSTHSRQLRKKSWMRNKAAIVFLVKHGTLADIVRYYSKRLRYRLGR